MTEMTEARGRIGLQAAATRMRPGTPGRCWLCTRSVVQTQLEGVIIHGLIIDAFDMRCRQGVDKESTRRSDLPLTRNCTTDFLPCSALHHPACSMQHAASTVHPLSIHRPSIQHPPSTESTCAVCTAHPSACTCSIQYAQQVLC